MFHQIFVNSAIRKHLLRRGPDHHRSILIQCDHCPTFQFYLESSVLHLRGDTDDDEHVQPSLENKEQIITSFMQWNGQIYRWMEDSDNEQWKKLQPDINDTQYFFKTLVENKQKHNFPSILSKIHGPYSMTYWNAKQKHLWIARDVIGRRSLCWNRNLRDKFLVITSVAHLFYDDELKNADNGLSKIQFEEIPNNQVYCFDLNQISSMESIWQNVQCYDWSHTIAGRIVGQNNLIIRSPVHQKLNMEKPSPELDEILKKCENPEEIIPIEIIEKFYRILFEAVETRCLNQRSLCKDCVKEINSLKRNKTTCPHATIAVLFSGGIDSTVLAALVHCTLNKINDQRPIDLINIAFDENAPDRKTGQIAWQELCELFSKRQWNFIEINVTKEELIQERQQRIRYLLQPKQTVLDDSIGCTLWFATKGVGFLRSLDNGEFIPYESKARVILLGMGADEQLGGYSRHRSAFERASKNMDPSKAWLSLIEEMRVDIERISSRNLGRDDRIITDHSIESRTPYLDEELIMFLNGLPIWYKTNPYKSRGFGEKWLLRTMAKRKLHLLKSSEHLKRAIQFGTKFVHKSNRKLKGHNSIIDL